MTYLHIYAPPVVESFCRLNDCPTCDRPRRMIGEILRVARDNMDVRWMR